MNKLQLPSTSATTAEGQLFVSSIRDLEQAELFAFGAPSYLDEDCFPTNGNVIQYFFLLHQENKNSSLKSLAPRVADKIVAIWAQVPIPTLKTKTVITKLKNLIDEYQNHIKTGKRKDYEDFIYKMNSLFDIAKCKCDLKNVQCFCVNDNYKIHYPLKELIIDQRSERRRRISEFR